MKRIIAVIVKIIMVAIFCERSLELECSQRGEMLNLVVFGNSIHLFSEALVIGGGELQH